MDNQVFGWLVPFDTRFLLHALGRVFRGSKGPDGGRILLGKDPFLREGLKVRLRRKSKLDYPRWDLIKGDLVRPDSFRRLGRTLLPAGPDRDTLKPRRWVPWSVQCSELFQQLGETQPPPLVERYVGQVGNHPVEFGRWDTLQVQRDEKVDIALAGDGECESTLL